MGATVTLTTMADLPGQNIDTGAVTEQARSLRSVGKGLENGTSDVLSAWQRLPTSYASTGADSVYSAMVPVGADGTSVAASLTLAAKALDQYVSDVQPVLAGIAALARDIGDFQSTTIPSYPKTGLGMGYEGNYAVADSATVQYKSWDEDPHAVEANHALLVRANSLTADLLAVQQTCATAIRAAAGLTAVGTKDVAAAEKSLRATDFHWNARIAVENDAEGCAGSTSRALNGIFYDGILINGVVGTVQGLGGLIGWDGDKSFSWDTFGQSWQGLGHLATGLLLASPAGAAAVGSIEGNPDAPGWMKDWERGSVGAVLGLTGLVGVSLPTKWWDADAWSKNDYVTAWEHDGWQTLGSSVFNVGTLFIGGAGAVSKIGDVGKLADGTRISDAAADGSLGALKGLTPDELRAVVTGLSASDAERLAAELAKPGLDPAALSQLHLDDLTIHHPGSDVASPGASSDGAPPVSHPELRGPAETYGSGDAAHPGLPAHTPIQVGDHAGGPGEWVVRQRSWLSKWADYQAQVSGTDVAATGGLYEYKVAGAARSVDFDGFALRGEPPVQVYLDAKYGYWMPFKPDASLTVQRSVLERFEAQALRQISVVPKDAVVEWHFSNPVAAEQVRDFFEERRIPVDVYYTPKSR